MVDKVLLSLTIIAVLLIALGVKNLFSEDNAFSISEILKNKAANVKRFIILRDKKI